MRQQQQRSRNRNRGRKSSNPLSRNFESNGPDVKIRGNANHIAEKYSVLARDAQTSGDTVMAENYFQHAEHYFRIVAAAQRNSPQRDQNNNQSASNSGNEASNGSPEDKQSGQRNNNRGDGPQPQMDETPAEVVLKTEVDASTDDQNESKSEEVKEASTNNRRNGRRGPNTRKTTRTPPKKDASESNDGLSDDAASLPSSLIGSKNDGEETAPAVEE